MGWVLYSLLYVAKECGKLCSKLNGNNVREWERRLSAAGRNIIRLAAALSLHGKHAMPGLYQFTCTVGPEIKSIGISSNFLENDRNSKLLAGTRRQEVKVEMKGQNEFVMSICDYNVDQSQVDKGFVVAVKIGASTSDEWYLVHHEEFSLTTGFAR